MLFTTSMPSLATCLLLTAFGTLAVDPDRDSYGDPLPAEAVARLGTVRFTHQAVVRFATGGGQSEWIVSGDAAGHLRLWRAETGELVRELGSADGSLTGGASEPSGQRVAVCRTGGRLQIFSVPSGELLREVAGAGLQPVWSADGRWIAATGTGTGLTLVDTAVDKAGEPAAARVFDGGLYPLSAPAFSADGLLLAAIEVNRDVLNGRERAIGQDPSCVRVWSVATGELVITWPLPGEVATALVPRVDGGFVIGTRSGHLFSAAEAPGLLRELAFTAPGPITSGAPGAPGAWFALGAQGLARLTEDGLELHPELACNGVDANGTGQLMLWRGQQLERFITLEGQAAWIPEPVLVRHGAPVSAIDLSADGALVLTAAHDGILRLWSAENGMLLLAAHGHEGMLFACDLAPDASRFASAGRDGTARIWNTTTGREELILGPFAKAARDAAFDATGEHLAVAVGDGSAWVFDARTGAEVWHVEDLAGPAPLISWSPDGTLLAVAGRGLSVRDGTTGEERWRLDDLGSPVGALCWSPDGGRLALGLARRAALVVDAKHGERGREFGPLTGRATGVAFAPLADGGLELLVTAQNGQGIRRWDVGSGAARGILKGHVGAPLCLAVAGERRRAATGGVDTLGLVWNLAR